MRKSILGKGLTAAVFTLPLAMTACGGQTASKPESNAQPAKQESQVIKVAYQQFGTPPIWAEEWLKHDKEEFEKAHPGVTIQLEPIAASENDFYTKIDLMMKSPDTAPDVVTEDTFLINSDVAAGFLEPLSDKLKSWLDWPNFVEAMQQGVTSSDGKIYGVPYSTDTRGLWYDTNIFTKAGLPVPWQPKNWQDILSAAETIKAKVPDVTPFWCQVGKATGEATTMQTFEMLLYGTNDPLFNPSSNKWIVKSPGFEHSLQFIHDIYSKGLGPQMSQVLNAQANNTETTQLMPKEKLAIVLDGNWISSRWLPKGPAPWADGTKVYQLAAMPTEQGQAPGNTSMSGGWALSIASKSKHKDMAWEFIKTAISKDNNKWYVTRGGNLSPRKDVAADPEYANTPGQVFGPASKFIEFTHFRPANTQYPAVSTQIQTVVEAVATGALSPQQAMDQYAQSVARIVGPNNTEEKK